MRCCKISHKRQGTCENKPEKSVIYVEAYLASDHLYGVNEYNKKRANYIFIL